MMSTAKYWWHTTVHRIPHYNLKTDRETQSMYHLLGTLYMYLPSSILGCLVYDPGGNIFFRDIKNLVVVKNINLLPYPTKNIFGIHLIHLLQSNEKLFSHYVQLSLPGCENTNSVIFLLSISAPGAFMRAHPPNP